jgi:hypothetical protein
VDPVETQRVPRGYGAVPRVLVAVVLQLLAITGILELVAPGEPAALARLELLPRAARRAAGAQVAAVDGHPWSAVLGLSSVRDGVDRDALARAVDDRTWIVLSTGGGSFVQLRHIAAPIVAADPPPDLVVIGLHAAWIADMGPEQLARVRTAWAEPRGPVQRALWPWRNRNSMGLWLRHLADEARVWALPRLGVPAAGVFVPARDPFAAAYETEDDPAAEGHRRDQLINFELRGWFSPQMYRSDGPEGRALAELLDALHARGTRVLVVQMPTSQAWRQRVPAVAEEALAQVLADRVAPDDILDLRATVPDALMFDHSHVLAGGRRIVTARIAAFVRARAGSRPAVRPHDGPW